MSLYRNLIGKEISTNVLRTILPGVKFFKITNLTENHNGLQYRDGLNVDSLKFHPKGQCTPGGMYFFSQEQLKKFDEYVKNPKYIREVFLLNDSRIYVEYGKLKTDKFYLGKKKEFLIDEFLSIENIIEIFDRNLKYIKTNPSINMELVKRYPSYIRFIENQTEDLCLEAVKHNGYLLTYIREPNDKICLEAVKRHGKILQYVVNKTFEISLAAVKQDGMALQFVNFDNFTYDQAYEIYLEAVKENGLSLQYIKESKQTEELCLYAIADSTIALQFVENQNEQIVKKAVKQNGHALEYVKEQTEEVCLEAVKQCGKSLKFVKNQTDELCLEAVKQNGMALQYVKNQTHKICLEAVKQNGYAINYVNKKTKRIIKSAIKNNSYIKNFILDRY